MSAANEIRSHAERLIPLIIETYTNKQIMTNSKRDEIWLKEWAEKNNIPEPSEDLLYDFIERVSIMIHDGGLSEIEARNEAADHILRR